jgi:hypothetical protein
VRGGWKQLDQLVPADLESTPIWRYTFRGKAVRANEGLVRPLRPADGPYEEKIVRARFRLADGTTEVGYCFPCSVDVDETMSPPGDHDPAVPYLQPAVVTDRGVVPFWSVAEKRPTEMDVAPFYARLVRTSSEVFPITFAVDVPLGPREVTSGTLPGFHFIVFQATTIEAVTIV